MKGKVHGAVTSYNTGCGKSYLGKRKEQMLQVERRAVVN